MNYYNEIKNELINNEINRKVKNYSINKSDLDTYYNVGKLLLDAGNQYGESIFRSNDYNDARKKFTIIYQEIINTLQNTGKIIVLDGTQLRFIDDVKKIKGELIVLRPSIETCIQRSINRKQVEQPELSNEELQEYEKRRREILYKLNPLLYKLIHNVSELTNFKELIIENPTKDIKL